MAANGLGTNMVTDHNLGIIPRPQPENAMSQLDAIIADTDDAILARMSERLEDHIRTSGYRGLSRENILKISRILAATYQAPDKPKTIKSVLAPLSGGYDIDDQKSFNKTVLINVGTGKQRVQFTAMAGLLATQAKFFKPLCSDLWKCGREGVISLEDYQPESFEIFLAWLYTKDIRNAKCLGKNITRTDYIGAPKFTNYMMDALTLAYREWVRGGFVKSAKDSLFNKTEETQKLVDSNTVESSPLRALIKDILFPSVEERQVPVPFTINRHPRAPPSFRRARRVHHNFFIPNSLLPPHGQNIQFPNDGTAPHPDFQPGHPLFPSDFPPTTLNVRPPPPVNHHMHNAVTTVFTGIGPTPYFHPHTPPSHPHNNPTYHPIPQGGPVHAEIHRFPVSHHPHFANPIPNNPFANHYNIRNQHPFFSPMPLPPRPTLRSRFLKAMKFGREEEKVDPESAAIEFKKWEKASIVWEHERCRYHIHAKGEDCRNEE
ncbi:hypothetical protein BOTNAR_0290g00070 [Botryotinia narcissicola]|uniref:BTB domain-containing protein n=1 Tax=Botryotinia narcissicola TaxID=278944 RepID=A0A4Z1HX92_9HELO|nr:hypothetical protein BOTNAR_0290g00070 [Botryotinia narcissicola]